MKDEERQVGIEMEVLAEVYKVNRTKVSRLVF